MKRDMIRLIERTDMIKSLFKLAGGDGLPQYKKIYDNQLFIEWSQELTFELQTLDSNSNSQFIQSILNLLNDGFDGWGDEDDFSQLCGKLHVIQERIDDFYIDSSNNQTANSTKKPKLFISHSSDDVKYVKIIVDFLEDIGLNEENLFCSSIPGYGIPLNEDIYDYLKKQFNDYDLYVIYVLSKNYYESPACLNEMGAAWVIKNKYSSFLLPNFKFQEIQGAINPRQMSISLDSAPETVNELMTQLKNTIIEDFQLSPISESRFLRKLSDFTSAVTELKS